MRTHLKARQTVKAEWPLERHWLDRVIDIVSKKSDDKKLLKYLADYKKKYKNKDKIFNPFESTKHLYD